MGKIVSIKDSKASYEIEEGEKTYYIRGDAQSQSVIEEFQSSFEVSIPKDTAVFNIHHDMNVMKEPVQVSKAFLVVGIIALFVGFMFTIIGGVGVSESGGYVAMIIFGLLFLALGLFLLIHFIIKSKTVEYRVTGKREETIVEVLSANNKVFSVNFSDSSKKIYEKVHKFIYEGSTEEIASESQPEKSNDHKSENSKPSSAKSFLAFDEVMCPVCETVNKKSNAKCYNCGHEFVSKDIKPKTTKKTCPDCGAIIGANDTECFNCGKKLI